MGDLIVVSILEPQNIINSCHYGDWRLKSYVLYL